MSHKSNSCYLNTTRHQLAVADTVVGEIDTADSTGHTVAEHSQAGCRLPAMKHYKPQPYAQTLHGTCPSGMIAYTSYALSLLGESPSYPSYHINPAWMLSEFISKLARKCRVLTEDVVRSLSALIYCRDLDTTTLRDLIDSDEAADSDLITNGKSIMGLKYLRVNATSSNLVSTARCLLVLPGACSYYILNDGDDNLTNLAK
nr:hypothetical protein [Tanacetum cinerariifolium]